MHPQLQEAHKRLTIAKDAYVHALKSIEGQYVKALVAAGVDKAQIADLRSEYYMLGEVAQFAERDQDPPPASTAATVPTPKVPKATKKK